MTLIVHVGQDRIEVEAAAGAMLDDVLHRAGLKLDRRCGGDGSCGGCEVTVEAGNFDSAGASTATSQTGSASVLACRTTMRDGSGIVRIPQRSVIESGGAIDDEFVRRPTGCSRPAVQRVGITLSPATLGEHRSAIECAVDALDAALGATSIGVPLPAVRGLSRLLDSGQRELTVTLAADDEAWQVIDAVPGLVPPAAYGIALDIGTTTVVGLLVELHSGRVLGKASRYNQQITLGADVASRISAAKTGTQLKRLQRLVVAETLNPIVDELCSAQGLAPQDVLRLAVAGNTVMVHLLLGLPVTGIGKIPFTPMVRAPGTVTAASLGLRAHAQARVDLAPAIAGYVGGDIVADIEAADLAARPEGTVLIDIGTNAEMVLVSAGGLVCCATPAGPAFEGAGLRDGCRAMPGAIARVRIREDASFDLGVIGDVAPLGICGSGVIDFVAEGRRAGWIDAVGRFDRDHLRRHARLSQVEVAGRATHACMLVRSGERGAASTIVVTEADVAEILKAKAAIAAGLQTLLEACGRGIETVPRIVLAGGFARRIDLANAMAIGLLPRLPRERYEVIGNGALAGACRMLTDRSAMQRMQRIHRRPKVVELNRQASFEGCFIDNLCLPEPDLPSPTAPLAATWGDA